MSTSNSHRSSLLRSFCASIGAALLAAAVPGTAAKAELINSIGTVAGGFNSPAQVTSLGADNYLEMYVPLSQAASGTLGTNGIGLTADYGSGGGSVDIYFNFGIISDALTDVKLVFDFIDIDLGGANDVHEGLNENYNYIESVQFFGSSGYSTAVIDNIDDDVAGQYDVTGNLSTQQIVISDISNFFKPSSTDPFIIGLHFTSLFTPEIFGLNSSEFVRGSLSATTVPEPASLVLLGSGAIAGLALRRRRRAA